MKHSTRLEKSMHFLAALGLVLLFLAPGAAQAAVSCGRTITANVVALDQPIMFNRLGAQNINGMVFALRRDVIDTATLRPEGVPGGPSKLTAGQVTLRPDKRPRPLVLRVAEGDCLDVKFQNLLSTAANPFNNPLLPADEQVADRKASFYAQGLEVRTSINDGGSLAGDTAAPGGLVSPGEEITYHLYAGHTGTYLIQSYGATFGSEGLQGNSANGLFGAINVEPSAKDASGNPVAFNGKYTSFYRSQLTEEEMRLAADKNGNGIIEAYSAPLGAANERTPAGQPIVRYEVLYPSVAPWISEGKAGLPILNMLTAGNELVHSDINAIIVGPDTDGKFHKSTYPLESKDLRNPALPNRLEPFREFTVIFHDEAAGAQVFPLWYDKDTNPEFAYVLEGVKDAFMINYGSGGVGSEIIANRLGVGPMHDCLTCAYEEFFLTSFAVGDPAMVVDEPANFGLEGCGPPPALAGCAAVGRKAAEAFYPDDPSNVHHSYVNDRTVFRNLHVGKEQHVFHLHNNQWLYNPNDDNSNYLDAQGIGPGSGYTYEIVNGGSGNRNKSAGDAIFHCHFYPHFAQGMWELWRQHDVLETGTPLQVTADGSGGYHGAPFGLISGKPALLGIGSDLLASDAPAGARARALPDGEIEAGTPIPALVPLPGIAMAVMPGKVNVVAKIVATGTGPVTVGSNAFVDRTDKYTAPSVLSNKIKNPGYPFWIAGIEDIVGQRAPSPPLDMEPTAGGFDGGLPRSAIEGITAAGGPASFTSTVNKRDFSKVVHQAAAVFYPEAGTDVEQAVMDFHGLVRSHSSFSVKPDGTTAAGFFTTNGYRDASNGNPSLGPQPGSPYHEPCIDDAGKRLITGFSGRFFGATGLTVSGSSVFNATTPRVYKGANMQYDVILNKVGYHYPQQRIVALWEDVVPTITKQKPGEPLVMRLNTFDCAMYHHTNLVPEFFEMDDYQVRTPTDIIGQHIHLPKWDLTTTDGSANGWNYEDGTFSPGAVRERIDAVNARGLSFSRVGAGSGPFTVPSALTAQAHPFFGATGPGGVDWRGARTTLQRWFADPLVNTAGEDRGLGVIFTHDHYGPSTHQQIGLYAAVLAEPAGSRWVHNETGTQLGCNFPNDPNCRADGGPTSWQAAIIPPTGTSEMFREFYFEFSDFQHAYEKGVYVGAGPFGEPGLAYAATPDTFRNAINPPARLQAAPVFPDLVVEVAAAPLIGCPERPCPQAISVQDPGVLVVNYRHEPVGLRVYDPNKLGPDGKLGAQAGGLNQLGQVIAPEAGDLAFALSTRLIDKAGVVTPIVRAIPEMNKKDCGDPLNLDCLNYFATPLNRAAAVDKNDPFTPMMRAYAGDLVRVKIQSGGHEEEHNATIHGLKWLQAGSGFGRAPNSGWRNSQAAGISEQFTLRVPLFAAPKTVKTPESARDYAYNIDGSMDGWWSGTWGLLRTYDALRPNGDLFALPGTPNPPAQTIANRTSFVGVCPANPANTKVPANLRTQTVVAVLANDILPKPSGVTVVPTASNLDPGSLLALNQMHNGGPLNPAGGTLVYNPRTNSVANSELLGDTPRNGPIHDPTAVLYVRASDLEPINPALAACKDNNGGPGVTNPLCPVRLKTSLKAEPLILRAAAGECLEVTLYSRLPRVMPDLPTFSTLLGVVKRDRGAVGTLQGSTTFNNNLIRPSSQAGLHAQLVMMDVSLDDGANVGLNIVQTVPPVTPDGKRGDKATYRWYAGDLTAVKSPTKGINLVATPVEFGGSGLFPADKIKQGQKSMVGGLVILPQGTTSWTEDNGKGQPGHQAATFGGTKRDFMLVMTKNNDQRYADGFPVEHLNGEGTGIPEDSQESNGMALNYGIEPLWFRFGLKPNSSFGSPGFGSVAEAHLAYSNGLVGSDPATPVFQVNVGNEVRMHIAVPHGTSRGTTFQLHGHNWQRDPYVCPGEARNGLTGACSMTTTTTFGVMPSVGSKAIGTNPIGFNQGGQESITPYSHFTFRLPKAGGESGVKGDYLFRDQAGFGNVSGLWGILRVQ